jgi:2'-5' RNA ligase
MRDENLYFIAIVPAKEICDEIVALQLDFARHFESKAALKVIPHITLKAPFKLPVSRHLGLQQWFRKLFINSDPFQVELKNFDRFYNKYKPVIYVRPVINVALYSLQKEIIRSFRISYPELNIMNLELKFKPHITVAYKDLRPNKFLEAWNIYKTKVFDAVLDVSSFHLLQHDGEMWDVIETYHIKPTAQPVEP